jgi:hypothetical protein
MPRRVVRARGLVRVVKVVRPVSRISKSAGKIPAPSREFNHEEDVLGDVVGRIHGRAPHSSGTGGGLLRIRNQWLRYRCRHVWQPDRVFRLRQLRVREHGLEQPRDARLGQRVQQRPTLWCGQWLVRYRIGQRGDRQRVREFGVDGQRVER